MKPGSMYELFSLVDYLPPRFLHPPLFQDDNIDKIKKKTLPKSKSGRSKMGITLTYLPEMSG
jgi:hypothetical protein